MFITALLLVWPVGHMNPHITDWATKPCKVASEFELATYQFECDALTYCTSSNTLHYMWLSDKEMGRGFWRTAKGWGSFWNNVDLLMLFSRHLNWNLLSFLPAHFHFYLEHYSWIKDYQLFPLKLIFQYFFQVVIHFNFLFTYSPYPPKSIIAFHDI